MQTLQAIDPVVLGSVVGGINPPQGPVVRQHLPPTAPPAAPPQSHVDPSQRTVHGNLGINARGVQIGAQVDYADSRTNYSQCLGLAERHNWTAAHVATTCGLPRS